MPNESAWLTNFMAGLNSGASPVRQPTSQEIAADIIRRSNQHHYGLKPVGLSNKKVALTGSSSSLKKGPSTIQKIFDVLSRPLYGTASAYKSRVKSDLKDDGRLSMWERIGYVLDPLNIENIGTKSFDDPYRAFGKGFTGKSKNTFADVLKVSDPEMGKKTRFAVGLGLDVFADPSTYFPGGAILKAAKGAKAGTKAAKVASETLGDVLKTSDDATATERVAKALNSPSEVLRRTNRNKKIPGLNRETPKNRWPKGVNVDEFVHPVDNRILSTSSSRWLPGKPRNINIQPTINATDRPIDFGAVPEPFEIGKPATKTAEALAPVVQKPGRKIDPMALIDAKIPRAIPIETVSVKAAEVTPKTPVGGFKIDSVDKVAKVELARMINPASRHTSKEHAFAEELLSKDGRVPVYDINGKPLGDLDAESIHHYLKTGKIKINKAEPKASDIPGRDATPEQLAEYNKKFGKGFLDKNDVHNMRIKVSGTGGTHLEMISTARKRVVKVARAKKLGLETPAATVTTAAKIEPAAVEKATAVAKPVDTTTWRKLASQHGLTKAEQDAVLATKDDFEALKLLTKYADKKIVAPKAKAAKPAVTPSPVIAAADDLVEAAGEGSTQAVKEMEKAVVAQKPKRVKGLTPEGTAAVDKAVDEAVKGVVSGNRYNLPKANPYFNPAKQVNAFGRLESHLVDNGVIGNWKMGPDNLKTVSTGKAALVRRSSAMKHLVELENKMIEAGHQPALFDGTPMRLSTMIEAAGGIHAVLINEGVHLTDLFGSRPKFAQFLADNPEAAQLVESARAAHAAHTAAAVVEGKNVGIQTVVKAENNPALTQAEVAVVRKEAPKVAKAVVKVVQRDEPVRSAAAKMAMLNTKQLIEHSKPPIAQVTERYRKVFDDTVWGGHVTPETVTAQMAKERVTLDTMGASVPEILTEVSKSPQSSQMWGLFSSLAKKFVPDYGQKQLRPIFVENRSLFQQRTSDFDKLVNKMSKAFSREDLDVAFNALQKGTDVATPTQEAASLEFQKALESMFGASGFKEAVTTDVLRETITMHEMNAALAWKGSKLKFSTDVVDELGKPVKLEHWSDAWKYMDLEGQHPSEFLHQMRDAVDHTMMERTMYQQIGLFATKNGRQVIDHVRLQGLRFDDDMAPQIRRFIDVLDEVKESNSPLWANIDAATAIWKKGVTYYAPAHHIRNLIGDTSLAFLAGVNNPNVYRKAITVLRSHPHLYEGWEHIDQKIAPGGVGRALGREANQPIIKARWRGGTRELDPTQVHQIMYSRGLLPNAKVVEDIPGQTLDGTNAVNRAVDRIPERLRKPLNGRGAKVAQGTSQVREHYVRTAHWLDAVGKAQKHGAKSLEDAIDYATRETRKWHPDGLDLANFEHRWMRRIFPFYSWTRKAIPLIAEGTLKKPAKIMLPNKVMYDLQVSMGLNPESLSEPFPEGGQFPDWIREMPWGPTFGGGRYIVGNNLNPWTSTGNQLLNDPRQGAASMLTPGLRIPTEVMARRDTQTGQKFEDMDKTEYIDKQIPLIAYPNSLLGGNFGAGLVEAIATANPDAAFNHKRIEQTESPTARRDSFLNFALAAGIIDTKSPTNLKSAEFNQKDRAAKASKAARDNALKLANR